MINLALTYWSRLQPYRNERLRCKNYTYGKQWKDIITAENGRRIPEEQYIREQGSAPLKNNLIRRIVRNVVGVFRNNYTLPDFHEAASLAGVLPEGGAGRYNANMRLNRMSEIYSRVMEEYLIGGLAVVRKRVTLGGPVRDMATGGAVLTDMVSPGAFFFNTDATDPRGWDLDTVGEIHRQDTPGVGSRRTVVELWRREDEVWRFYFLDDAGNTLLEGDSPFPGGGHPYVMKAYPFIDGEIHSFVADCIDQQRYINRLITLNDWIIRASAKGVLLFPEGALPDDLDLADIADQWSRHNGVIRYKARTGIPQPQQVSANSTKVGISELLEVQLKMMEDVSGINSALQGKLSHGVVSGTLYRQQTRHAISGLTDILEGFRQFMTDSAVKDVELLSMLD